MKKFMRLAKNILSSEILFLIMLSLSCKNQTVLDNIKHSIKSENLELIIEKFNYRQGAVPDPTIDILFVIDDSCSMKTIIENVKSGIAAISDMSYPEDTVMAVMYTSPVRVQNDGVTPDFESPWHSDAEKTPGHMQLINMESVQAFFDFVENDLAEIAKFPIETCTNKWFSPDDNIILREKNACWERCRHLIIAQELKPVQ